MKHLFIDHLGFNAATLCALLLQIPSADGNPMPNTIMGYLDKLGTIGLLIYFLWRDRKESNKREERYDKEKEEIDKRYQSELQVKVLFYEQQMQKQRDFYDAFYKPNKSE